MVGDVSRHHAPRRYPRMARVNEVVREALGDELERLNDPRLGLVTITGVDVSADLRQATVYYSALGRSEKRGTGVVPELAPEQRVTTHAALQAAAPHLRAELGRQVRLKYTPQLTFPEDPAVAAGDRIEAIIRDLHRDDARGPGRVTAHQRRLRAARGRRSRSPRPIRSRWPATSIPTATRSARCWACSTCCGPTAATSWRRSRTPFSVAPHYRELPGLELLSPPDEFPRRARRHGHLRLRVARPPRRPRARGQGRRASSSSLDHHVSNTRYGTINVIDPAAAASGVLVRRLALELGLPLTNDAAVACTPRSCATPGASSTRPPPRASSTSRGELVAFDVPVSRLSRQLFEEHRFAYLKLLGEALAARRARRRAAVRVDRGHPGHARAPRRHASKRSRA